MIITLIFFLVLNNLNAQEGYPEKKVTITYEEGRGVVLKNQTCFDVTIFVNQNDYHILSTSDKDLPTKSWSHWTWLPGFKGSLAEKEVLSPLLSENKVSSGPGEGIHKNEKFYGYDFSVPLGTPVRAMMSGRVVRVVEHYAEAHQDEKRLDHVNRVEILHEDGSLASYSHLNTQSVSVNVCDQIQSGHAFAQTGHNGYSSGPHLHVEILRPAGRGKIQTIPLKFK